VLESISEPEEKDDMPDVPDDKYSSRSGAGDDDVREQGDE
jgi:hypothetical protein